MKAGTIINASNITKSTVEKGIKMLTDFIANPGEDTSGRIDYMAEIAGSEYTIGVTTATMVIDAGIQLSLLQKHGFEYIKYQGQDSKKAGQHVQAVGALVWVEENLGNIDDSIQATLKKDDIPLDIQEETDKTIEKKSNMGLLLILGGIAAFLAFKN